MVPLFVLEIGGWIDKLNIKFEIFSIFKYQYFNILFSIIINYDERNQFMMKLASNHAIVAGLHRSLTFQPNSTMRSNHKIESYLF